MPSIKQAISSMTGSSQSGQTSGQTRKYAGVVVGLVTNNQDPEKRGRVKVKFPWLSDDHESNWAQVAMPMVGKEWGVQFIPEVEDTVLVAFEQGDINYPYVIGSLYNGEDKPPEVNSDGKNNIRVIKSRSGHIIEFDDTDGSEKLTIKDNSGKQVIVFDTKNSAMTINCGGETTFESSGDYKIKGANVEIEATGNIKLKASGNLDAQATGNVTVQGSGTTAVKGATVNIN